ncbi:YbaB/EbfC family nucleoid-associated protein [Nocardia neocaledoniensis]|uniref:YbaB/EbfC family nucleoid-associated protein n=1 Tax=Nocardia neocaledoniensis TaxID=236511 RepID=UPI002458879A|nr:YbaB/EbfC family nucleoid-associated protein [Nocardia neocaledoniensis]
MANDAAYGRLEDLADTVREGMETIARAQLAQSRLTATATAAAGRVVVTVNAENVVIEVRFAENIGELGYEEIARAVTTATQDAAVAMRRKTRDLLDTLRADTARIPRLSEYLPGIPDVQDMIPEPPRAPVAPPSARQGLFTPSDGTVRFTDDPSTTNESAW